MAPLRFRAWDKKGQQMVNYIRALHFYQNDLEIIESEHDLDVVDGQNSGHYKRKVPDVILMQYTGLQDKNGKEVFEGDVVTKDGKVNAVVEWMNAGWIVRLRIPVQINLLAGYGFADGGVEWQDHQATLDAECEVIGNIYEKPDLLS